MAEVLSKSNVFSSTVSHQIHHGKRTNLPIRCSIPVKNRGKLLGFSLRSSFSGLKISVDQNCSYWPHKRRNLQSIESKLGLSIGKAQRWWEKGLQPNMKEITSAEDLVDSLLSAGDKLVVVDFFSPGCGGCKALHPKMCQLAEMNPNVQFLQVNYEEHKSMCYSLNVHVLPFFRFYRGAEGRVCSFSCTNATFGKCCKYYGTEEVPFKVTRRSKCEVDGVMDEPNLKIKKFKDALAKYGPDRCTLGPAKGLEEKELIALADNKDLSFTYTAKPVEVQPKPLYQEIFVKSDTMGNGELLSPSNSKSNSSLNSSQPNEEKTLAVSGR